MRPMTPFPILYSSLDGKLWGLYEKRIAFLPLLWIRGDKAALIFFDSDTRLTTKDLPQICRMLGQGR